MQLKFIYQDCIMCVGDGQQCNFRGWKVVHKAYEGAWGVTPVKTYKLEEFPCSAARHPANAALHPEWETTRKTTVSAVKLKTSASLISRAVYCCCCCFKAWHSGCSAEVWRTPSVCLSLVTLQEVVVKDDGGVGAVSGSVEALLDM